MANIQLKIISTLLLLSTFGLSGCFISDSSEDRLEGNGEIIEKNLEQDEFTGIHVNGVFDVELHPGESHSLTITGDENLVKEIEVEVKNDILYIKAKKNLKASKELKIDIFMEEISQVVIAGAANLESDDQIETEELILKVSGAGNVDLDVSVESLEVSIAGAGNLKISGKADESNIGISGAGNLEGFDLKTHDTELKMSGAGNVEVYADESLEINLSGLGRVVYKGNPSSIKKDVSGLGVVSEG